MTFRSRVLLACLVVSVAPMAVLTFGIRHEVDRTVTSQYRARVAGLMAVIREDMARQNRTIETRLRALASGVEGDARVRAAALRGEESSALLDWAGRAMPLAGLDYLMLLDPSGRILSSGHFRNEYDRRVPALDSLLRGSNGPILVRARTAEGAFLALVRGSAFEMGGARFLLAGGLRVDRQFLGRLSREEGDGGLSVALLLPGDSGTVGADSAEVMSARLTMPFFDDAETTPTLDTARVVVVHSLAPLGALERRMDVWFAGGLLAAFLLALLIARAVAARTTRPLTELAAKTRRVDLDRLDVDFRSARMDEVGTLARLMAAMVERLRASAGQLRQAERRAAVGDMARQVNHDIRNGLVPIRNVIRHLTQVARESPDELAPVFAEREGTLDGGITYLEGLASAYARLSPKHDRRPSDLNEVVRGVIRDAVVPNDGSIRTELFGGLPRVAGDPVALRRIVENLVVNAMESLDRGGSVVVTTAAERGGDGPNVVLTVADTGSGMDRSQVERIFENFFTTKPEGTGLGLSIVRRLVADLGGRIEVESEPGRGSRFRVELPALDPIEGARAEAT